jgi:hypothetical protein
MRFLGLFASITRDTFTDSANRKRVEFQLGQPAIDNELNEAQEIAFADISEAAHASMSQFRATDTGGPYTRFGCAMGTDWRPYANGTTSVYVTAGYLYVDGVRYYLAADLDLTSVAGGSLTFSNPTASVVYGVVYVDFVLTEVNATQDPTISTPLNGQTTVREVWTPTFHQVSSTTSFEAAEALIPVLSASAPARPWLGNTARVHLFRYVLPAEVSTTIAALSNGLSLPQSVINVATTAGLPGAGTAYVTTAAGPQAVTYTGLFGGTQLTGCSGGTGLMSTGGLVTSGYNIMTTLQLQNLVELMPVERMTKQWFLKTFRSSQTDGSNADGMVSWDVNTGYLQIGSYSASGPSAGGMIVRSTGGNGVTGASSPDVYALNSQYVANGGATPPLPAVGAWGWSIPDGSGLGWLASGPTLHNNQYLGKSDLPFVFDFSTNAFTLSPTQAILGQKLAVVPTTNFQADPASFCLVVRIGQDLVWFDGTVTRGAGASVVNYPGMAPPGEAPMPYRAVLAANGNKYAPGSNTITGADALERALNWSVAVPGYAAPAIQGSGQPRNIRLFLRSGTYQMLGGTKVWGDWNAGADSGGNAGSSIVIEGEEGASGLAANASGTTSGNSIGTRPAIRGQNPAFGGSGTRNALLQFYANCLKLKSLNFAMDDLGSGTQSNYLAAFVGDTVILEDCTFFGPVYVQADNIIIKNCRFLNPYSYNNTMVSPPMLGGSVNVNPGAALLFLAPNGGLNEYGSTKNVLWDVRDSYFFCQGIPSTAVTGSTQPPYAANVVLKTTADGKVRLVGNVFDGAAVAPTNLGQNIPSIHVLGTKSLLQIAENKFINATGAMGKTGNNSVTSALPFNGDYTGAPMHYFSGSGVCVATAYISMTVGRDKTSRTLIEDNYFDFSYCGGVAAGYTLWGACLAVFSGLSVNGVLGSYSTSFQNITYRENHHNMSTDSTTGWSGTTAPSLYGFYLSRLLQDGVNVTGPVSNISVTDNTFDIGFATAASIPQGWRSIAGGSGGSGGTFPAATGVLTDTTVLIGIVLRNYTPVATPYALVSSTGIRISRNKVYQRAQLALNTPSPGSFQQNAVACNTNTPVAANAYWCFVAIALASGDGGFGSGSPRMADVLISENIITAQAFGCSYNGSYFALGCSGAGIAAMDLYTSRIVGNVVDLYLAAAGIRAVDLSGPQNYRVHVSGNTLGAVYAVGTASTGSNYIYISDNYINGGTEQSGTVGVVFYTAPGTNSNFP